MFKSIKNLALVLCLVTLSLSCSMLRSNNKDVGKLQSQQGLSAEEIALKNQQALKEISKRIVKLIEAAKKSGSDAINFLADDIYLKASSAALSGDYQTSSLLFKHVSMLKPKDMFVKSKYAISLIRVGQVGESKALLEEIYKKSKYTNESIGLILAGVYSALTKNVMAQKTYKRLLKYNPQNQDACIFLAKLYASDNKQQKALSTINRCEKRLSVKSAILPYFRGKLYLSKGKLNKARKSFVQAIKINPNYFQAVLAIGIIDEEQGHWQKAIKNYKQFLDRDPSNSAILERIIQAYFTTEKFQKVIPYAEKLLALEPDNLNIKVKLGVLYTDAQKFEQAVKIFKDILVKVPSSDKVLYYLGAIYQEIENLESAVEYFSRIEPDSILYKDSILQSAQILSALAAGKKNPQNKERFLDYIHKKIAEKDTSRIELSMILAGYYETTNDVQMAIKTLQQVQKQSDFKDTHLYYLASLYEKEKKFKASVEIIEQIIENDPKNAHAWNFMGYSLLERNVDLPKAYQFIQKALTLAPQDGYIRDSLGWYYFKIGQYDKALHHLTQARKKVNNDVTISKHLGIVYQSLKRFSEARKHYQEAIQNSKSDHERNDISKYLLHIEQKRLPASKDMK